MKYAIGIDMGGTKIEGVLVDQRGKIFKKVRYATQHNKGKQQVLNNLSSVIEGILVDAPKIVGIALGMPGFISENGVVKGESNLRKLKGLNIKKFLEKKFKTKVIVENDANCFALAEHHFGASKGKKISIGVIWGTGLGAAIIIDGKVFKGGHGLAGEPGHTVMDPKSPIKCGSGHYGDLESFVSAPNLIKHYKKLGGKNKQADGHYIIYNSDKVAKQVTDQAVEKLAIALAFMVNLIDPEIIVLGGGLSNSHHYAQLNILLNKFVATSLKNKVKVVKYKVSDSSGAIGAASLVF